jgi:SpoVK/Ycf46/Vps4 family AAA+-type ATPase
MARSDLLVSIIKAGAAGDRATLKTTTERLVAEERAKSHHSLADRLHRALQATSAISSAYSSANTGNETVLEIAPRIRLDDLVLTSETRTESIRVIEEHQRADILRAHGYEPRHKVLLSGPPGNGKTSYAESIAEALALPFFVVRYDSLVSSFLGETNSRLKKLFDYVRTQPCVLFFDEFDSISKERGDNHETGEIKRVVSFLLMQMDQLPSYVITIAATNHAELLDKAVWRRFQLRLNFPSPDRNQIAKYLENIMSSWESRPKLTFSKLADAIKATSYSEAQDFCLNLRRQQILGLGEKDINSILRVELDLWSKRIVPEIVNHERPRKTAIKTAGRTISVKSKSSPKRASIRR